MPLTPTPRGSGLKIGRILGIPIFLHASWFIIFLLMTPSLASKFGSEHADWTSTQYWTIGLVASLLFFASVVLHELGHSSVALHYKIPVVSITLFVFGGLARIGREPERPKQEFNIAIAGPIVSFLLAGTFWGIAQVGAGNEMLGAPARWLAEMNFYLGAFNLAPGFPLDGGRILRAAAWAITGNFARASRIASRSGKVLAYAIILVGAYIAMRINLVSGVWYAFIGWFLLTAAQETYAQIAIREALDGLRASDVMSLDLSSVARDISLEEYSQEILRTGRRCHLVATGGQLHGMMTVHALNQVPRNEWHSTSVQAAMLPLDRVRWAMPEEPVLHLLDRMQSEDVNQMPVLQTEPQPHVVGMVSRDSILRVIQARAEIGKLPSQ